ncbi:MAG: cysteine--tRNA ligase [Deltaproteobacteria bacterium]|nr:cysteine--tRNA ligase [Deltaproteobacteria bacterium]MBW2050915.1 cysteine--tRNA ligase [Deltaproteobacteria bacterium]
MSLVLYNTATREKEPFIPLKEGRVAIYVCGPTVYDESHIGHARCYIVFDILIRYLKYKGFDVQYVRNFTDLDDKIIKRAQEENIPFLELAQRNIEMFHQDMDALGLLRPDVEPRATEHIELMVDDIQSLVEKGYAYQVGTDVYYEVASYPAYGNLSKRDLEDMQAGARIEVDPNKKNPLDFVLWKECKPGEPSWPSPWGPGRPGWHLECSTMSAHYLGPEFDIHGGGYDLVFPHHENEIAQAAPLNRKFARYWMHNGFVQVNHRKMSKSLKNFFTIREVLDDFHPEVLRLFVLSKHYRSPLDFFDDILREEGKGLERAYRTLKEAKDLVGPVEETVHGQEASAILNSFIKAMDDDINTARALGHIYEGVRELNRLLDDGRTGSYDKTRIRAWVSAIREMGQVLGILVRDPDQYLAEQTSKSMIGSGLSTGEIEEKIKARSEARAGKDWAEADRIRDELREKGVILEDAGGQTRWRFEI